MLTGQAAPPNCGAVCVRVRDCVPPPHDFVHVEYVPHVPILQSTGHACVLQSEASVVTGHSLPFRHRHW